MKKLTTLLIMALCHTIVIYAHNPKDDDNELYKRIVELQDTVKAKEKEISKLRNELAVLQDKYDKTAVQLEEEKNSVKKNELKELRKQITQLQKDSADCADNLEATLKKQAEDYEKQLSKLRQQHSKDSANIAAMQQELDDLINFRQLWIADLAKSVDEQWMKKPFSQIDIAELEKTYQQCNEFAKTDKKIAEAAGKLKLLLNDCKIYQQGMEVINNPYDASAIKKSIASVKTVYAKTVDKTKKDELKILLKQLEDYGVTVVVFQNLIKDVDKAIKGQETHKAAWKLAEAKLNQLESDKKSISDISFIPWLKEQYDKYYSEISKNCMETNDVKELIMQLKPEY